MKLSSGEKLILIMLSEIYEKLELNGEIDPKFIKSAIINDQTWGIGWEHSGIQFEDETPAKVYEVAEILDMWNSIEYAYNELSAADKLLVEKEANPFGKDPKFKGFDGNNEGAEMCIVSFLINDLNRYQEFKGRDLNSHAPSMDAYKRMYTVYKPMISGLMGNPLDANQLIQILHKKTHPDHR